MEGILFLGVTAFGGLVLGWRALLHSRTMRDTPTSKIRSAHQGYVEIEGTGRAGEQELRSPLSGTPCLWWSYRIAEREFGSTDKWRPKESRSSEAPFYLEDDTGRCRVYPKGAEVVGPAQRTWYGDSPSEERENSGLLPFMRPKYRYTEHLLLPDGPLYALGEFITVERDPTRNQGAAVQAKLDAWRRDREQLMQFDVNRDGRVDAREWEAATHVARAQAEREVPLLAHESVHTLSKSEHGHFLISTTPQHQLTRQWGMLGRAGLIWFIVGGALFIWLMAS
jgi:hypothetical protein